MPRIPEPFAAAVRKETRLVLVESPTNPTLKIVDLKSVTGLARERGLLSVRLFTLAGSLGGAESLATLPALTTRATLRVENDAPRASPTGWCAWR